MGMRDYLMGGFLASKNRSGVPVDKMEIGFVVSTSVVSIHEEASARGAWVRSHREGFPVEVAFFDAVLMGAPPHVAKNFFESSSPIRQQFLDTFQEVRATAVVHLGKEGLARAAAEAGISTFHGSIEERNLSRQCSVAE